MILSLVLARKIANVLIEDKIKRIQSVAEAISEYGPA